MSDSQRLRAIIEGDARGAVRAFDQVADGAERMGKDVDRAAKQSSRSLKDFQQAGVQVGQGLALLGGAFALASRETVANEQALRTLERGYGDTAESLRDFADEIQRTTTFSNESAITAANNFRNLTDQYGFTVDQIQTLIQVSADLATTSNIDLADAAFRVQSAMRGEAEAAEVLGLTLNDASLGIDRLAKDTTNAEKSQIRFNALLDQASFAQGAASERAATTAGQVEQLANRVQDATQRFVQWTGPVGEAAGSLGSFGLEAGLAAGGLVRLGQGLAGAAPLARGLVAALGPAGLILAAGAAGIALIKLADSGDTWRDAAEGSAQATDDLNQLLGQLAEQGTARALLASEWIADIDIITGGIDTLTGRMGELEEQRRLAEAGMTSQPMDVINRQKAIIEGIDEEIAAINRDVEALGGLENANKEVTETKAALAEILGHTGPGFADAAEHAEVLFGAYERGEIPLSQLMDGLQTLAGRLDDYDLAAIAAAEASDALGESAAGAAGEVNALGREINVVDRIAKDNLGTFERHASVVQRDAQESEKAGTAIDSVAVAAASADARIDNLTTEIEEFNKALEQATADAIAFVAEADNIDDVLLAAGKALSGDQGLIRLSQDVERTKSNLDSLFDVVVGGTRALGQSSQQVADWSDELVAPGRRFGEIERALSTGRITLGEYNAAVEANTRITENNEAAQAHLVAIQVKQLPLIASHADAYEDYIQSIAELPADQQRVALAFADSGEKAKIAGAFATAYAVELGEIPADVATQMIVSDAQADPVLKQILKDYELIEEDAHGNITVNFEDGPTITDTLTRLTTAIEHLNLLIATPEVDLDTTAFDTKVQEVIGDGTGIDEATYTSTFDADNAPYLEVAEGVKGDGTAIGDTTWAPTIDVNTAPFDEDMRSLPGPLREIDETVAEPTIDPDTSAADADLPRIEQDITDVGAMLVSPTVTINDQASGTLGFIRGELDLLNGRVVTFTTRNVTENIITTPASGGAGTINYQHGGVVPSAQHGLVTPGGARFVRMNEAGGEDVLVPGGSYIRPAPASRLARGGGGGDVHIHIGTVYGDEGGVRAAIADAMRAYGYATGR